MMILVADPDSIIRDKKLQTMMSSLATYPSNCLWQNDINK